MSALLTSALAGVASQVGAPLVRRVLERRIGAGNARLAEGVVKAIAERAGTSVEALDGFAREEPEVLREAVREVEMIAPEMIELQMAEMDKGHVLAWAWRPFWMYLLGFLWVWAIVVCHVLNAIFKIALPQPDLTVLLSVTGLFLALYMGGHTVKTVFGARAGR